MSVTSPAKLYTPDLLALAVKLAEVPLDGEFDFRGQARSRTCGGTVEIGLSADNTSQISQVGMLVSACSVGQAAAALFAGGATGQDRRAVGAALTELEGWLGAKGPLPRWPGIEALEPAIAHPGRHGTILLPWKAALAALPKNVPAQ